ncbi:tumor necrosis factor receptor superfamily member 25-like isoform X2 [Xiphophorus maculatus]|uniref:tumor necrosis factor receptor superfamily member 25-like isoform X2 n=1 Tax=Xiphophorus maculatus TaxID=8083 RepID=UPI000C6E522B|nr:tumor necrosis factor receptor superfamily member 25-like isoform X2 [Xiphophorus maculatus]
MVMEMSPSNLKDLEVVSLILAFMSTRVSLLEATGQDSNCIAGYYKDAKNHSCKLCPEGTYTDRSHSLTFCLRCSSCGRGGVKKPCTASSDEVCICPSGHYSKDGDCKKCSENSSISDINEDYCDMCQACQSQHCMKHPGCKTSPISAPSEVRAGTLASTAGPASPSGRPTPSTTLKTSSPTIEKVPSQYTLFWLSFVGIVTSLLLFWFLLLFCRNLLRKEAVLPCWNKQKKLQRLPQEPKLDEQRSHHCSSPTTQTFTVFEETPMMSLCQEPPAHVGGHVRHSLHTDARRYEHCDRWPAIVLYAIIKEVPLRRWKEFLRLLSVSDQQMERVEMEAGLGSMEKQYQMLRLWSQRSSASLNEVYSSLHLMELSGCVQQLQENLERLQWRCEAKQALTA